jgi:hypothetical protein
VEKWEWIAYEAPLLDSESEKCETAFVRSLHVYVFVSFFKVM